MFTPKVFSYVQRDTLWLLTIHHVAWN